MDFSQGLRAIGVAPDEKLALFADNSCRWLVADQGKMLFCFEDVACIVIPNVDKHFHYCYFSGGNSVVPDPFYYLLLEHLNVSNAFFLLEC